MINYRMLTDEGVEKEAESRIVALVSEIESIHDDTLPEELLHQLLSTVYEYNWEGLVITEHYQAYEDYKMNNKGY